MAAGWAFPKESATYLIHKVHLNRFNEIESHPDSSHDTLKVEISNKEKSRKHTNTWRWHKKPKKNFEREDGKDIETNIDVQYVKYGMQPKQF